MGGAASKHLGPTGQQGNGTGVGILKCYCIQPSYVCGVYLGQAGPLGGGSAEQVLNEQHT